MMVRKFMRLMAVRITRTIPRVKTRLTNRWCAGIASAGITDLVRQSSRLVQPDLVDQIQELAG